MNKTVYLGLSIVKLSKILMYQFSYDDVKPKYGKKAKLCYMDTYSVIAYMIYTKILQKMLKRDLILQIMNQNTIPLRDHCLKKKIKK